MHTEGDVLNFVKNSLSCLHTLRIPKLSSNFRIDPNNHNSHADIVRRKLKCENAQFAIDWIPDADEDVLIYIGADMQLLF